ncbi:MAG: hypothetical protein ABIR27_02555 [Dokdonella sp.]
MVRQTLKFAASLFALSLLGACSSHSSDADNQAAAPTANSPAPVARKPTVFDDQLKALDKAKAVEEDLKKAQAERDKQIDEQTGG